MPKQDESLDPLQQAGEICRKAIESVQDVEPLARQQWARHRLIDFNHWAEGIGLFAGRKNSLHYRLREHFDASNVFVSVLNALAEVFARLSLLAKGDDASFLSSNDASIGDLDLRDHPPMSFSPWSSDEDSDHLSESNASATSLRPRDLLTESCKDAENLLERLLDLANMVRNAGLSSRLIKADLTFDSNLHQDLETDLVFLLRLANSRQSSSPDMPENGTTATGFIGSVASNQLRPEQTLLISANLRRRHRFAYARKRNETLSRPRQARNPIPVSRLPVIADPAVALSEAAKPAMEWTDPPEVIFPIAVPSQSSASAILDLTGPLLQEAAVESTSSWTYAASSTQFSVVQDRLDYPKAPKVSQEHSFKCPCCYQVLPKRTGTNEKTWRKHIARDLYPYNCPVVGCMADTLFFVKKMDWETHIREHHKVVSHWECPFCSDGKPFFDTKALTQHFRTTHGTLFDPKNLNALVDLSKCETLDLPPICPVCNMARGPLSETDAFMDHLAEHLHDFALLSLPWNDSSFNKSQGPPPDGEALRRWLDDTESHVDAEDVATASQLDVPAEALSNDIGGEPLPEDEYFCSADGGSRYSHMSLPSSSTPPPPELGLREDPEAGVTATGAAPPQAWRTDLRSSSTTALYPRREYSIDSRDSEIAGTTWARSIDNPWDPCIVTLDGGGVRAYSCLLILKALMHAIWIWERQYDSMTRKTSRTDSPDRYGDAEPNESGRWRTQERSEPTMTNQTSTKTRQWIEDDLLPCHYFDFMFGTSSGGLVATLLGRLRMTVKEALNLFPNIMQEMFGQRRSRIPLLTKYYHEPLERSLRRIISRRCRVHNVCAGNDLHPWDASRFDEILSKPVPFDVDEPRVCQTCCLSATLEGTIPEAYLFRTYPHYYSDLAPNWITRYNEGADRLPVWQVVRATMATPFYFDPVKVELDGQERSFQDGGTRENNPSGAALSEFHALYDGKNESPAIMLSLGTGKRDQEFDADFRNLTIMKPISRFLEKRAVFQNLVVKFMEGESQHNHMRRYARGEHTWYKRLNVSTGLETMLLDEWESNSSNTAGIFRTAAPRPGAATLMKLEEATEEYLTRSFDPDIDSYAAPSVMLSQAAQKLVLQRRAREEMGGPRWDTFVGKHSRQGDPFSDQLQQPAMANVQ